MFSKPSVPLTIDPELIHPIEINGLTGRMVVLAAHDIKKRDHKIVMLGGHHTAHERTISFGHFLQQFGTVYMIDLPGFGGMNSFQTVGMPISYESYATYLKDVLKKYNLTEDVTVFAVSIALQFMTRMFQMFPETVGWFRNCVGFVGFTCAKDFNIKQPKKFLISMIALVGSNPIGLFVLRIFYLNRFCLGVYMYVFHLFKKKMQSDDPDMQKKMLQMEKYLWLNNDQQTHATMTRAMFSVDLRDFSGSEPIPITLKNVVAKDDQYFDITEVRKNASDLYAQYEEYTIRLGAHMPSMLSGVDEVAQLFEDGVIKKIDL